MIEASKDITPNEMVLRLEEDRSVPIGRSTLDVWLRKRGFTFKKDRACIGAGAAIPPEAALGIVKLFEPQECANYFAAAGHAPGLTWTCSGGIAPAGATLIAE